MGLRRITGKIDVLTINGSEIHALKPDKAIWDEYTDELFVRDEEGELVIKSSRGLKSLYRACVKKITNVEVDGKEVAELTNPDEIVEFLTHLADLDAGRTIDSWLLGLGKLEAKEVKN